MPSRSKGFALDPTKSIIPVEVLLEGPRGQLLLHMALDTGATYTIVPVGALQAIGYEPAASPARIEFFAAASVERRPVITVRAASAFGIRIARLPVVCHDLPPRSPVRGLLGLNFLKQIRLHLDFPRRRLSVSR